MTRLAHGWASYHYYQNVLCFFWCRCSQDVVRVAGDLVIAIWIRKPEDDLSVCAAHAVQCGFACVQRLSHAKIRDRHDIGSCLFLLPIFHCLYSW